MINVFTRPITTLDETEPNLIHRVSVKTANSHIDKLTRYHKSSGYVVPSDHPICSLIQMCDRDGYDSLGEYLRVVIPNAEYTGRILGMFTELYAVDTYDQQLTGTMNTDLILTYSGYTSTTILKCIEHPWTYVDYRIPDNTWNTPAGYSVWTLNLVALFTAYFIARHTQTIKQFVFGTVLVGSIGSIVQQSLINRVRRSVTGDDYDSGSYTHPRDTYPALEKIDRFYTYPIIEPHISAALNTMPSIYPQGQFHTKHLPNVYKAEHIGYLWMITIVPTLVNVMLSSRGTLHRLERTNIRKLASVHRQYSRLKNKYLPAEHKNTLAENVKYLNDL